MDTLDGYRQIIETVLADYARDPYAYGDIGFEPVIDRVRDRYVLMCVGWQGGRRVHHPLIHLDIIDGKVWIQSDNTEDGVAYDLLRAGIPKDRIVLGFQPPEVRADSEFAAT
jgi:XisI protein